MRPTATDDAVASLSLSVTQLRCAKTAECIKLLFEVETLAHPRHTVLGLGTEGAGQWREGRFAIVKLPRSHTDLLDQQRAGVEWQDVYGSERVGTRRDHMEDNVTGFFSISRRTSDRKM